LEELDGIHQLIDWKPIEQQMPGIHAKKQGESAWPPLLMFKAFIEAKQSRPRKGKGKDGENTLDSEAGYNVKVAANGKTVSTYGYKARVNVDEDGFVKAIAYTPGNEHDSYSLKKLPTRTEHQLYADKAYASAEHDQFLAKRGTANRIPTAERPAKTPEPRQWSSIRSTVEHVFGILKQHYGRHLQGALPGTQAQPSPVYAGGDGLQHQARRAEKMALAR
jgi:IS5 family transposase